MWIADDWPAFWQLLSGAFMASVSVLAFVKVHL